MGPYRAGVQVELIEVLLDAGAAIDGLEATTHPFGSPSSSDMLKRPRPSSDVAAGSIVWMWPPDWEGST